MNACASAKKSGDALANQSGEVGGKSGKRMTNGKDSDAHCVFYGRSWIHPGMLLASDGNQCALVVEAHAPCYMERAGDMPDARRCTLIQIARIRGDMIATWIDQTWRDDDAA